jgi:hypothetical protein
MGQSQEMPAHSTCFASGRLGWLRECAAAEAIEKATPRTAQHYDKSLSMLARSRSIAKGLRM